VQERYTSYENLLKIAFIHIKIYAFLGKEKQKINRENISRNVIHTVEKTRKYKSNRVEY
jgi:hypothetical protein